MNKTIFMVIGFCMAFNSQLALSASVVPSQFKLLGQGVYSVMFWDIYSAELFAPDMTWQPQKSYALRLTYFREFSGQDIAQRSVEEIEKLGFNEQERLQRWYKQMQQIFPDVKAGESLTGVRQDNGVTVFFKDQKPVGQIEDIRFSDWFFGIWLAPETSAPELRQQLLGRT